MELHLVRDVKNNKKWFYRYIGQKRLANEIVFSLVNWKGEQQTADTEKAEVLRVLCPSLHRQPDFSYVSSLDLTSLTSW